MPKNEGSSRVSRRANTKSAMHKACQNKTRGIIPRERRRFANYKIKPEVKAVA